MNTTDLLLLNQHPEQLLVKYVSIFQKWRKIYQQKGWFYKIADHAERINARLKQDALILLQGLSPNFVPSTTVYGFLVKKVKTLCNHLCDEEDRAFLANNETQQLVVKYQNLIQLETELYRKKGGFPTYSTEEIVQEVNEVLLRRIVPKLAQFEGKSLFRTYFKTVVRNLLHEIHKRLRKVSQRESSIDLQNINKETTPQVYGILNQVARTENNYGGVVVSELERKTYYISLQKHPIAKQKEFEFCAKTNYHLLLQSADVFAYWQNCPDEEVVEILSYFSRTYNHLNKGAIFKHLAHFVSQHNQKIIKSNTLQKRYTKIEQLCIMDIMRSIGYEAACDFSFADFIFAYYPRLSKKT
ncbi:MAG: RNA polymerase sigma factor [Chitinophagales bacterium]